MSGYSEQDLEYAAEFREEIHREALAKVRKIFPDADSVTDRHPVGDYFREHLDYPGTLYTIVAIPYGYESRAELVDELVKNTVENYRGKGGEPSGDESFYELMGRYPRCVVDYYFFRPDKPYRGFVSHREALGKAAERIAAEGQKLTAGMLDIRARHMTVEELFAPADKNGKLNYRTAFLHPPHGSGYTDEDFDKVNEALFPNGTDCLEAYQWSTDWSDYFDDGHEWWGALCLTVYDRSAGRFTVIMASATD